jgi:N utilization substance protein A
MALDKVGHFVLGVVVKANPDKPGYLTLIGGTDRMAVLPRSCADGAYRVGDQFYACIKSVDGPYPTLSQRSGHFLRRVAHLLFAPLIAEGRIQVKAVGTVQWADFVKIAVVSATGEDPIKLCLPYLREFASYSRLRPCLVRYSPSLPDFIKQALVPAPLNEVQRVSVDRHAREAEVVVSDAVIGRFLGNKGMNVAVASRVTGYSIRLFTQEGQFDERRTGTRSGTSAQSATF